MASYFHKIWAPKVLHGALAAATDIWLYRLTTRLVGQRYATVAVSAYSESACLISDSSQFFLSITSFFHGLALSRSLSNSLETSLTTIALSYFPWGIPSSSWRFATIQLHNVVAI